MASKTQSGSTEISFPTLIRLEESEILYCAKIGKARNASSTASRKVKNMRYTGLEDEEIHKIGVVGEYAYLKTLNMDTKVLDDTSINSAQHDRGDIVFEDGTWCDVKATMASSSNATPTLRVAFHKWKNIPEWYALAEIMVMNEGNGAVVKLHGFAKGADVMNVCNLRPGEDKSVYEYSYRLGNGPFEVDARR